MKKLLLPALAALAVVFIATLSGPAASGAAEKADGEALFVDTHECNMCHSVAAAKIPAKTKSEKLKGPDLSGFQTDHSLEEISAYVRKQAEMDGMKHKKEFKGTDEELQAIIDWLGSLEAKE